MACNCGNNIRVQAVTAESVAVAAGVATVTLPATFLPVEGGIYDMSLAAHIPDGTNGAEVVLTNGTVSGNLLNRLGSNVRMGPLNAQWVLRVMFLGDPDHWNLISRRWRRV